MPVRQALNAVFARVVSNMDSKERKSFIDDLYGYTEMNRSGNDVLRDIRFADETMTGGGA
jgi:hypothetical protein